MGWNYDWDLAGRAENAMRRSDAALQARTHDGLDPSANPPFDPVNPWNHVNSANLTTPRPPPPRPNRRIPIADPWYIDDVIPADEQELRFRYWFETVPSRQRHSVRPQGYPAAHYRWYEDPYANGHVYEAAMVYWRARRVQIPFVPESVREHILEFTRLQDYVWQAVADSANANTEMNAEQEYLSSLPCSTDPADPEVLSRLAQFRNDPDGWFRQAQLRR